MPEDSLGGRYLKWLYGQVASTKVTGKRRTFWALLSQLHETIFVAITPHDENRIADAKDLRHEYLAEHEFEQGSPDWMAEPCSMLELLVVLARQLGFEMDEEPNVWFWHLLETIELSRYADHAYDEYVADLVDSTLERVIWRQYAADGQGGLFPLRYPDRDQRNVELWYQLNAFLLEHF